MIIWEPLLQLLEESETAQTARLEWDFYVESFLSFLLFLLYANIVTVINWWLFRIGEAKLNKCITALGGAWGLFCTTKSQKCKLWFSISANTVIHLNAWASCQCQAAPVCRQGSHAEGPAESLEQSLLSPGWTCISRAVCQFCTGCSDRAGVWLHPADSAEGRLWVNTCFH